MIDLSGLVGIIFVAGVASVLDLDFGVELVLDFGFSNGPGEKTHRKVRTAL